MQLPQLNVKNSSINILNTFMGYNHNSRIADGEFYDMKNLTTDYFPMMAVRPKRAIIEQLVNPMGMFGCDKVVFVDDNKLYYDQGYVCDLKKECAGKERRFAMIGAYLCVFPDKLIYNTYDQTVDYMENEITTTTAPTFSLCKLDGTVFDETNTYTGNTAPDTEKYKYWIDTSQDTVVIKMWSNNTSEWTSVATTYVKVSSPGIGKGFKQYDAVTFSGVDKTSAIYNDYNFNQSNILYSCDDDNVVIVGFINKVFTNSGNITLKREVPDMDFVAEMDNRVWGCSSEKHEIYACKQGDPKNWNCFMGLVSDSYAATIGTDGDFTGCINYMGTIYFFKNAGVHYLFGSKPSDFQINWKTLRGVQKGSEKSLVVLNEYLYYKSRDGICVFDGSSPESISDAFGKEIYYDATGGAFRDKYYVCMRNTEYEYSMFVYDSKKSIWIKEDNTKAKGFARTDGALYLINENNVLQVINYEKIYTKLFPMITGVHEKYWYPGEDIYPGNIIEGKLEDTIEWSAETGLIGLESPFAKYIKNFKMRLYIDTHAYVKVEVSYDSSGAWEELMKYYSTRPRSIELPLKVRRCDHMQLRLSGKGNVRIYSIAKEYEEGSGKQ